MPQIFRVGSYIIYFWSNSIFLLNFIISNIAEGAVNNWQPLFMFRTGEYEFYI